MFNFTYFLGKLFSQFITSTFFREIEVIGLENIPKDAPTILYGNHNNQFLDALLLVSQVQRQVSFIGAAKSMRRPIIGHIGQALGVIPVERPQDLAKRGTGQVLQIKNGIIKGQNTRFMTEIKPGDLILVQGISSELLVQKIISNYELQFKCEDQIEIEKCKKDFKLMPKVDQSQLFESVWQALKNNQLIGIFPEGGSHDRTELLPLKAGICIMALGAMQKYNKSVYLQPVGLNYFKGHKFRSKVIIEFGIPKNVSEEYLTLYQQNKKEAIANLLKDIEKNLQDVKVSAPSFSNLSALYLIRQIYLPDHKVITPKEGLELIRRFAKIFNTLGHHPDIMDIRYKIKIYQQKLKYLGIPDYQVRTISKRPLLDTLKFLYSFLMMLVYMFCLLPGFIMTGPIALMVDILSEKERKKALAGSKVKIQGKDVVGSYKVLSAMFIVPIAVVIYTMMFYLYAIYYLPQYSAWKVSLYFIFFWPMYVAIMLRSSDGLVRHARTVKAKILFFFSENTYVKLRKQREELQEQIRSYVPKYAQFAMGQDDQLIVPQDEYQYKNLNEKLQEVFECLQELGC